MSIDSQIKEMMALATKEGLQISEIRRESHSAKESGKRPVYRQLLADIAEGKFTGILTWAPDRLSRNAGDLGSLVDMMDRGLLKEIRCHSQRFTNNPNEKFLFMILCSQAKLENDNRGINVKRGQRARAEQGYRPCVPPVGYLTERRIGETKSRVVPDPVRAPFIRKMYEKIAIERWSGRQLYEWIYKEGFLSRGGKRISLSMVFIILSNPYYTGRFEYPVGSGSWYQGDYEPIVSQQLYDDVRRFMARSPGVEWGSKEFAFTRLMRCGTCGSGITADEKKKQLKDGSVSRHVYYRCTHTRNRHCKEPPIKEEPLIEQLITLLDGLKLNASAVRRKIDEDFEKFSRFAANVLGMNEQKARKINQRKYVEFVLRNGTMEEKRELLSSLKNRIVLKQGCIQIVSEG